MEQSVRKVAHGVVLTYREEPKISPTKLGRQNKNRLTGGFYKIFFIL